MKTCLVVLLLCMAGNASAMEIPDAASPDAVLYAERCSVCHALPHPKRLDWQHWRPMLAVMKQRMDEQGMAMDTADWRRISAYLKSHAR